MGLRLLSAGTFTSVVGGVFYLVVTAPAGDGVNADAALAGIAAEPWDGVPMTAALDRHLCERGKYDPFFPENLVKRSSVADHLAVAGASERFRATVTADRMPEPGAA